MIEHGKTKRQEIKMLNRKLLEISGVLNVESFDSEEFLLETECGFLTITGQNLHIKNLNLEQGLVAIEGTDQHDRLYRLRYGQNKSKGCQVSCSSEPGHPILYDGIDAGGGLMIGVVYDTAGSPVYSFVSPAGRRLD